MKEAYIAGESVVGNTREIINLIWDVAAEVVMRQIEVIQVMKVPNLDNDHWKIAREVVVRENNDIERLEIRKGRNSAIKTVVFEVDNSEVSERS